MNQDPLSIEASKRLVGILTFKVCRRMKAAGARLVEREEVEQELWVAWATARESYDPTHGVPFAPYFYRGALNHINRWFKKQTEKDLRLVGLSLDDCTSEDEDDAGLHEVIADETVIPADDVLLEKERRERVLKRLSPLARRYLELLDNPPPALCKEIDALKARAEFCRKQGRYAGPVTNRVSMSLISDLLGLSRTQRAKVYGELQKLAALCAKG
jgi:hypothetical protein